MNNSKHRIVGTLAFVLGSALLTGCVGYTEQPRPREAYLPPPPVAYAPPPPPAYAPPPPAPVEVSVEVVVRTESDFYEPLSPYGRWEMVGPYGRCWIPSQVGPEWRPYCQGRWERTDAGWYWASDEPWAWATYHYGRWDLSPQFGWYWVPQTQWAPAWVSWHEGGGYVGWAPLHPSARVGGDGSVAMEVALIAPRAFVFVEPRRFLEPVRPATVVVNNTTIINNTVNITNIKVVNNTVINEGPRPQVIEQASGQKLQAVPVRELRRKQEAAVVARQRIATPAPAAKEAVAQPPIRHEAASRDVKASPASAQPAQELQAASQEQLRKAAQDLETKTQAAALAQAQAQAQAQLRAGEATAKAQQDARTKAQDAQKLALLQSQQRSKELEKQAQAQAEMKARSKPELHFKPAQLPGERGKTNMLKKAKQTKGEAKPTVPENPPAAPKASP